MYLVWGTTHLHKAHEKKTLEWPSERLSSCPRFMEMETRKKLDVISELGGCCRCLSWRHGPNNKCRGIIRPCKAKLREGWRCWAAHHTSVHMEEVDLSQ